MRFDFFRHVPGFNQIKGRIPVVNAGQRFEWIKAPTKRTCPTQLGASLTNGPGSKASAGSIGGRGVKGNAHDRNVDTRQIARVFASNKAGDALKHLFTAGAVQAVRGDRKIIVHQTVLIV